MRVTSAATLVAALLSLSGSSTAKDTEQKPCHVKSPTTNAFYDLSSLTLFPPSEDTGKRAKEERNSSWTSRGYDYGANFTLNFCAPVVEDLSNVRGLSGSKELGKVAAFYRKGGKTYSIGESSEEPIFRGKKLVLNYTNGSPCDGSDSKRDVSDLLPRRISDDKGDDDDDDDDDDDNGGKKKTPSKGTDKRRKSTIISFLCQRDVTALVPAISFVGTVDECTYVFEARTQAACEGTSSDAGESGGGVGPEGVFGLIILIAVAVYIFGGVAYQRTVMHQRGWRQLPNYGTWASIWNFIKDFVVIIFSSCSRLIPRRRGGYNQLPSYTDRSRFSRNEDENRLIDQLDEEWDE